MKLYIEERAEQFGNHIISEKSTVRETASVFGISKSTVHKDVVDRLPQFNRKLAELVREVLEENKSERHIRGGIATKNKYKKLKEKG